MRNNDIFSDITSPEEADLQVQFRQEMEKVLKIQKARRPMQVYDAFHVTRQTGTKYLKGKIPTKRPAELRRLLLTAVTVLGFDLTYRGEKLTEENLLLADYEDKQLDLFDHAGFQFEINRKKSSGVISLELRIRGA